MHAFIIALIAVAPTANPLSHSPPSPDAQDPQIGWSLANVRDVDGDGYDDFVVGAILENEERGSVTCVSGKTGAVLYVVPGVNPKDHFGSSLVAIGDCNGDGVREFLTSSSYPDADVLVYSGKDGKQLRRHRIGEIGTAGTPHKRVAGTSVYTSAFLRAALGDIDHDGVDEYGFALDLTAVGDTTDGVYVISGKTGELVCMLQAPSLLPDVVPCSLAGVADLDDDGIGEIAVGFTHWKEAKTPPKSVRGAVVVFSGKNGKEYFRVISNEFGFGHSVVGIGDANDDGMDDILIGSPNFSLDKDDNPVRASWVHVLSGKQHELIAKLEHRSLSYGLVLLRIDDQDEDGVDDFVVTGDDLNNSQGEVFVYSTRTRKLLAQIYDNGEALHQGQSICALSRPGASAHAGAASTQPVTVLVAGHRGIPNAGESGVRAFLARSGKQLEDFQYPRAPKR